MKVIIALSFTACAHAFNSKAAPRTAVSVKAGLSDMIGVSNEAGNKVIDPFESLSDNITPPLNSGTRCSIR